MSFAPNEIKPAAKGAETLAARGIKSWLTRPRPTTQVGITNESASEASPSTVTESHRPIESCQIADFVIWHLNEKLARDDVSDDLHIFQQLSQDEMDAVFPVLVVTDPTPTGFFSTSAQNWKWHTFCYRIALDWFLDRVEDFPIVNDDGIRFEYIERLYALLTREQQVILQRGFEIMALGKYRPRVDGSLYHIELGLGFAETSKWAFPVIRKSTGRGQ